MSVDEQVAKDLIETLEDGHEGFTRAAERLEGDGRSDLAAQFSTFASQRSQFADELRAMAADYGDRIEESGSAAATLHRGWMAIKDALSGSNPDGVLDAAEQGEDHAVAEYQKALEEDLSPELRSTVERQYMTVTQTHDVVRSLRDSQPS